MDTGLLDWVAEAMAPVGAVTHRRMMGGATLYCDGVIFAIIARDELWFKADAETNAAWDAMARERFSMTFKDGTVDRMNYRRAPDDVYDDPDELRRLALLALEAGRRRPPKRKAKSKR